MDYNPEVPMVWQQKGAKSMFNYSGAMHTFANGILPGEMVAIASGAKTPLHHKDNPVRAFQYDYRAPFRVLNMASKLKMCKTQDGFFEKGR